MRNVNETETKASSKPKPRRKARKRGAGSRPSLKQLEKRLDSQDAKFDRILKAINHLQEGGPEPEPEPEPGPPPFKYMFMSPHKDFCQVLKEGTQVDLGMGNYRLIPPILADFSDKTPGPRGFWGTDSLEKAEQMRRKIKMKFRPEVIEVTDDPTFNPAALKTEGPKIQGRPDVQEVSK